MIYLMVAGGILIVIALAGLLGFVAVVHDSETGRWRIRVFSGRRK